MDNKKFHKEFEKCTQKFEMRSIRISTALTNIHNGKIIRNYIILILGTLVHFSHFNLACGYVTI